MYQNQISCATIGGHGMGARAALLSGIYKPQNMTGFFAFNYSPLNYNYFQFGKEWKKIIEKISKLNLKNLTRKHH